MSQNHSDGPPSSSGHRFGYRAAADAGVPMGWVLRQRSPEQREHDARNAQLDVWASDLFRRFRSLSGFRHDEYGRTNPGWWLVRNRAFLDAVHVAFAVEAMQAEVARHRDNRRKVLEAAITSGFFKP